MPDLNPRRSYSETEPPTHPLVKAAAALLTAVLFLWLILLTGSPGQHQHAAAKGEQHGDVNRECDPGHCEELQGQ